jgi:hypothetical protein
MGTRPDGFLAARLGMAPVGRSGESGAGPTGAESREGVADGAARIRR